MPKVRWIQFRGQSWRLSHLAAEYHLTPKTLSNRIDRFGTTSDAILRALSTGIVTRSESGRRGAMASPWGRSRMI